MNKLLVTSLALCATLGVTSKASADEGMWQPHQLPGIAKELKAAGLKLNPNDLTDLTGFPMGAIVSLGGCTASFLSDQGLVASNHHCVYGSVQYNSTEDNNLLKNGFLAKSFKDELPAAPGTRIYVTEEITEVTDKVNQSISATMKGADRYNTIDKNSKALVAECENDDRYRCSVVNFHGGLQYFLFKQLTIRDVRLVHAPASSIGKFGGDTDNWMWPRHTGDYGFYRAYVGKDGQPADYSKDNVPYKPKHHLKVSKASVKDGDFLMVVGYPGRTNRYRTALEVDNTFNWTYPNAKVLREDLINIIDSTTKPGSDEALAYASTRAGLANYAKNFGSMIESFQKGHLYDKKVELEKALNQWIAADNSRKQQYGQALSGLDKLIGQNIAHQERDLLLSYMGYSSLKSAAERLYRLSIEKTKADADRKRGYQERDMARFEQSMKTVERRYVAAVDKAFLKHLLGKYAKLPKDQRVASMDKYFGLEKGLNQAKLDKLLDKMYAKTELGSFEARKTWMDKSAADFERSKDPFIQLAVATYKDRKAMEDAAEELSGNIQAYRPKYMEALIAYYQGNNMPVYADANSTLRVTYGNVKGYSPKDGSYMKPFTTLQGIIEKYTGEGEFDSPQKQLDLIKAKQYGDYYSKELDSVPVNYLGTLDITGGNSGSPTLNDKAEFVGLAFDGVYESIIGDWDYDEKTNRSIHVDVKYMLWVMENVDGATNLIDEMDIVE
ncbi:S46 family peptidase [Paraferrimonas haliotis]|uniref:S46 family peptidase n=1 Tax=Paraferrimonas haliotis TaxID=2013866 RepID=UPI000BA9AB7D|nr:S46 family peptidase [Paraferrimonas haliotis]